MKRRDFLLTSAAVGVSALVPIPSVAKPAAFATGGIVHSHNPVILNLNCRCVISPEHAGRIARYQLEREAKVCV